MNGNLPGPFFEDICGAFKHAFRSKEKLGAMLRTKLDKTLSQVSSGNDLSDMIYSLAENAEAEGWIGDLIKAAAEALPRSQPLQQIWHRYQQTGQATTVQYTPPLSLVPPPHTEHSQDHERFSHPTVQGAETQAEPFIKDLAQKRPKQSSTTGKRGKQVAPALAISLQHAPTSVPNFRGRGDHPSTARSLTHSKLSGCSP